MKNLFLLLSVVIFASCISKKNTTSHKKIPLLIADTLNKEEENIVNDFLDFELASERYKNYINREIILIEEAGDIIDNLLVYEYAYKDFHSYGNKSTTTDNDRLGWILDSIQIKELKNIYVATKDYHWKSSDIRHFKVSIIKNDAIRNIINKGEYTNLPEKLLLNITRPLIINNNNAFISFRLRNLGFNTINYYTALMKKVNGKWLIQASYWDGRVE